MSNTNPFVTCVACGNQYTSRDRISADEAKFFVCHTCDEERKEEMRREIAEMEDEEERWGVHWYGAG